MLEKHFSTSCKSCTYVSGFGLKYMTIHYEMLRIYDTLPTYRYEEGWSTHSTSKNHYSLWISIRKRAVEREIFVTSSSSSSSLKILNIFDFTRCNVLAWEVLLNIVLNHIHKFHDASIYSCMISYLQYLILIIESKDRWM